MALLAVTRGQHFASIESLPSASWAVFFLAGAYITRGWIFPVLLAEAVLLDYAAITYGGVSSFCVSPAYSLLILAYGALWFAGKIFSSVYKPQWSALLPLVLLAFAAGIVAEIISSGGFYYFSGRFTDPTLAEFGGRLTKYAPSMFSNFAFYLGCATVVHVIAVSLRPIAVEDHSPRV